MKKIAILLGILMMGVVFVAQANAITINAASGGEENIWTIADGWGFSSVTQANLESNTTLTTLAAGSYTIIDLAKYAGDTNVGGFYTGIGTVPLHTASVASIAGTQEVAPSGSSYNSAVSISFHPTSTFGFYNDDTSTSYLGTTQNQNASNSPGTGVVPLNQSNGYIFNLGLINAAYTGDYLVAFEDGDSHPP